MLPILLGQILSLGVGVAGVRLASSLVAPADYGIYGLFVSLTPLGAAVIYAGLVKYVARHWHETTDRQALKSATLTAAMRKAPWLVIAAALTAAALPGRWLGLFPALLVAASALGLLAFVQTALQADRANWRDFGVSLTGSLLRTLLPLALYALVGGKLQWLLVGFALYAVLTAAIAMGVGGWGSAWRTPRTTEVITTYDGPRFVVLAAVGWAMGASGRAIVAGFFGAAEAGYFVLAGNVALVVVSTLYAVVLQFFQPRLFAYAEETSGDIKVLTQITDLVAIGFTLLGVAGVVVLRALMPWLVGTLIAPQYADAANWLLAAGSFHLALLVPMFFHLLLIAARRESACGPAEIGTAIVLLAGGVGAAALSADTFRWFAMASPVVAWLVARPIAIWSLHRSRNRRADSAATPPSADLPL
ncbi:MAG: hypothetical protein HYV96_19350 [Opitutae bacterium]|nr:hypothetical protein [Opitutae bacterium]